MKKPSSYQVALAKRQIAEEDEVARQETLNSQKDQAIAAENSRRSQLPSEHPEHICGLGCDGQDGQNSYCARLRRKLFNP